MRKINTLEVGMSVFFIPLLGIISFHMILNISLYDTWLSILIGSGIGIIPIFIYLYLNRYNNSGILMLNKDLFGKRFSFFINLFLVILFFLNTLFLLCYLCSYISTWYLKLTPSILIILLILLVSVYAFKEGAGTLFRSVNMFFYVAIIFLIIMVSGSVLKMDFAHILPILEHGIQNPFLGGILYSLFSSTLIFSFLIVPNKRVVDNKTSNYHVILFYLLGCLASFFMILAITTMIDPILASMYEHPEYVSFAKITFFASIEKLQSFIALFVVLVLFVNITFSFYFLSESTLQLFKVKHQKKMYVITPVLLLLTMFSFLILENISTYMITCYPILLLIILLLFSVIFIRVLFKNMFRI